MNFDEKEMLDRIRRWLDRKILTSDLTPRERELISELLEDLEARR